MKIANIITRTILGLLFIFSTSVWADIEFNDAYNFRDVRVNVPLTHTPGDLLLFGVYITDSDTGDVPAGAIVRAKNTVSLEEFVLSNNGTTEYYQSLPYTVDRAAGNWIVEVNSDVGERSINIPAFGIGSGTGPMPAVENLTSITGSQPQFNWGLPLGLPILNGGNVNRLRVRIVDSYEESAIDDKLDNDLTSTTYTTEPGIITHNGAFLGQIMVEGLNPFSRSRNYTTFVVESAGIGGVAVTLDGIYHARDFRGANSVGWRDGDRQDVSVNANPYEDTYVHVEQAGTVLQAFQAFDSLEEFDSGLAYDPALGGIWNIIAWNGAVKTTTTSHELGTIGQLPLVTNIRIEPDNLTPIIHWNLPVGNTVPFDEVFIGLFDDVTNARLQRFGPGQDELFDQLLTTATSYQFSPGVLEEGARYVVRVLLVDSNGGNTINRSVTFFNFTPIMDSGIGEIFLPTLDAGGIYNFEFDVTQAVPVTIDPEVAVGYIYEIGDGDPRFASVELPFEGDGMYDLTVYNDDGSVAATAALAALESFNFITIDPDGISKFEVAGIETSAGLDPLDTTAFMTKLTFASSGKFTGSMTPITENVEEPEILMCDANVDGTVDIHDIRAIARMRRQPATGPDDPMDWDGNGIINIRDARGCQSACALPRCAVQVPG